ncbi:hypothetical protein L249_3932, partial [Ophiocordyceps polyrhachis-furcata BCC 54312]
MAGKGRSVQMGLFLSWVFQRGEHLARVPRVLVFPLFAPPPSPFLSFYPRPLFGCSCLNPLDAGALGNCSITAVGSLLGHSGEPHAKRGREKNKDAEIQTRAAATKITARSKGSGNKEGDGGEGGGKAEGLNRRQGLGWAWKDCIASGGDGKKKKNHGKCHPKKAASQCVGRPSGKGNDGWKRVDVDGWREVKGGTSAMLHY